jgi:hypothetical protein
MCPDNFEQADEFISYPTDRVVGTIDDAKEARKAIDALLSAGFTRTEIDVLHGEEGLERLDPTGAENGFFARFHRTLIRAARPAEENRHLMRHVEDVRAGRFVVMVLAKHPARRDVAADILSSHGAEFIGFYGRWAYQALDGDRGATLTAADESPVGTSYELRVGDATARVRVQADGEAVAVDQPRSAQESRAKVSRIAPGIFLVSWQDPAGTPVVHVANLASGIAYGVTRGRDGTLRHETGTVQRST